jgi:hypothetical protein
MKRCPQCLFIYPESDQHCDFDQTPLVVVDDSEIDSAAKPRGNKIRFVFVIVAAVIVVGVVAVFLQLNFKEKESSPIVPVVVAEEAPQPPPPPPSPSPSVSPSPSPSPSPKPSPARVATSHTSTSVDPVSTSGPGSATRRGAKPTILLTSGGKIDADEVWRTRDGYWYRKNGIVTLLKPGRVKAVVNR